MGYIHCCVIYFRSSRITYIVVLCTLAQQIQLDRHYDWGLRAVKSVLVVAGQLKRAEPELPEDQLLMRALRDFNIPKIVQQDEIVFFGLLNDLFPGVNPPRVVDSSLATSIIKAIEESDLWPDEHFTLKVAQLDELLAIRHCVFVMGPAGAGKSVTWKMLARARDDKDPQQKVYIAHLNPKVIPTEVLYGHIMLQSREWKDGLLSSIMRDLGQLEDDKPKWYVHSPI
jgi:dynein heavy chain